MIDILALHAQNIRTLQTDMNNATNMLRRHYSLGPNTTHKIGVMQSSLLSVIDSFNILIGGYKRELDEQIEAEEKQINIYYLL